MSGWLRFFPGGRRLYQEAEKSVRERLGVLRGLSEPAICELAEHSDEELYLGGHMVTRMTWHVTKEDGSHWVVIQIWGTGFILGSFILAQGGFTAASGIRRELEAQELFQGGFD